RVTRNGNDRVRRRQQMARLDGRKIVVTGGASGIGRATCELFMSEGAAVAVLDRNVARIDTGCAVEVDVANPISITHGLQQAAQALDGIDGLVNAPGVFI